MRRLTPYGNVFRSILVNNGGIAIRNGHMKIAGEPVRGRAARLWITAAFLSTTWASDTQGFPEPRYGEADAFANTQYGIAASNVDFGRPAGDHGFGLVQPSPVGDKPVLIAQATRGEAEEVQKALEQEHRRAELFERLLTLHKDPAELARFNHVSESEYAELRKSLQQVRDRLKQTSENGAATRTKPLQGERVDDRLEQALAAAKYDVEMQAALAKPSGATQLTRTAEGDAAELKKSLQQERDHAERLEQDLAAARRAIEAQAASAAKANGDATQLKRTAEGDAAELKWSLQQERAHTEHF
jgi:hypothetical protein